MKSCKYKMCVSWKNPVQNWQFGDKIIKIGSLDSFLDSEYLQTCNSNNKRNKIAINTNSKCYIFNAAKLKLEHLLVVLTSILFQLLLYQTKWDDKH